MSTNGKRRHRRPARPRIEMAASIEPQEAAAVTAAVEQFLADTAPAPAATALVNPWQRAALLEGVSAKRAFGSPDTTPRVPESRRDRWP